MKEHIVQLTRQMVAALPGSMSLASLPRTWYASSDPLSASSVTVLQHHSCIQFTCLWLSSWGKTHARPTPVECLQSFVSHASDGKKSIRPKLLHVPSPKKDTFIACNGVFWTYTNNNLWYTLMPRSGSVFKILRQEGETGYILYTSITWILMKGHCCFYAGCPS